MRNNKIKSINCFELDHRLRKLENRVAELEKHHKIKDNKLTNENLNSLFCFYCDEYHFDWLGSCDGLDIKDNKIICARCGYVYNHCNLRNYTSLKQQLSIMEDCLYKIAKDIP